MDAFINAHPFITSIICIIIIIAAASYTLALYRWCVISQGKDGFNISLTPTQKFILAASSPTIGNNYKCVIDIWDTHKSESGMDKAKQLFEWGWGEFTYENAKNMVEACLNDGYHTKFRDYCSTPSFGHTLGYTDFERQIMEETKSKYPKQGMLAWDLVRVLSIAGGAYMGGIMEYEEAAHIAFETCKLLQDNFSSWDDMVGSYTLGYQFWRGKKKTDRLKYYKKLKRFSWIYKIPWNTTLREEELYHL